jgi:uncharacterized RDD family membrane protein YckC
MSDLHPTGQAYAGRGLRFLGELLDSLLLFVPLGIVLSLADLGFEARSLIGAVVSVVYNALLDGGPRGQTIGKRAVGVWVRSDATGGPIGVEGGLRRAILPALTGAASGRGDPAALGALLGLVGLLDALWIFWDDRRQTLHDKLAGSVVLDARDATGL